MTDANLLEQFVASFSQLDDMLVSPADALNLPPELDAGIDDSRWARPKWQPARVTTSVDALDELYRHLPGRLPPLYEQLVLTYRWLEVTLDEMLTLKPNWPNSSLHPLLAAITVDPVLVSVLFPQGLVPIGKAANGSYDPICFDLEHRLGDGDCPVVRMEHEAILCNGRIGASWTVAPSFRTLVEQVISKAAAKRVP